MFLKRRFGFGLGTFFSLIVMYFIYLYSKDKGWALLALLSKWYLIIIGGLIALSLGMVILVILFSLLVMAAAMLRLHMLSKRHKKGLQKGYIDAEYEVKE